MIVLYFWKSSVTNSAGQGLCQSSTYSPFKAEQILSLGEIGYLASSHSVAFK